jgi:hypothetical protein
VPPAHGTCSTFYNNANDCTATQLAHSSTARTAGLKMFVELLELPSTSFTVVLCFWSFCCSWVHPLLSVIPSCVSCPPVCHPLLCVIPSCVSCPLRLVRWVLPTGAHISTQRSATSLITRHIGSPAATTITSGLSYVIASAGASPGAAAAGHQPIQQLEDMLLERAGRAVELIMKQSKRW